MCSTLTLRGYSLPRISCLLILPDRKFLAKTGSFNLTKDRYLPISFWRMRSIELHQIRRQPCWKRCRSEQLQWQGRIFLCPNRFLFWRHKTPLNKKELSSARSPAGPVYVQYSTGISEL